MKRNKRMHLIKKKRKNKNKLNIITVLIILIIIAVIYLLNLFSNKALPQFLEYSEIETKKVVTSVINDSVIEKTYKNQSINDLFIIDYDKEGNVENIDYDSKYVNQILVDVYNEVEKNLYYLETGQVDKLKLYNLNINKKGIIYELPSGIIFNNVILNNIFPKIPVKMHLVGNIFCRLDTDIKSYGINNALITVNVVVEVEVKILLPFVSKNTQIKESIPILIKIIEGEVPSYYFGNKLTSPSIY